MRTNQKSLKFLLEQRVVAGDYRIWLAKLMGYDFVIEYKEDSKTLQQMLCLVVRP